MISSTAKLGSRPEPNGLIEHTYLRVETLFQNQTAAGVTLNDWLSNAITSPASVTDAVEEGSLATSRSGSDEAPPLNRDESTRFSFCSPRP